MKFVERNNELAPVELFDESLLAQVSNYGTFLGDGTQVQQKRLALTPDDILYNNERAISKALHAQFDRKCAFTETKLQDFGTDEILLFRPNGSAEWAGQAWPHLYWWLMADWSNMFAAATVVTRRRGRQFPVLGDYRPAGPDDQLDDAVLLNPCVDRPEWFLRFFADGTVEPAQIVQDAHEFGATSSEARREHNERTLLRARASIDLYQLDGYEATESRQRAFDRLDVGAVSSATDIESVLNRLDDSTEHQGAVRQVLASSVLQLAAQDHDVTRLLTPLAPELSALLWTADMPVEVRALLIANDVVDRVDDVFPDLRGLVASPTYTTAPPNVALAPAEASAGSAPPDDLEELALPEPALKRGPRATTPNPQIASVTIRNFKAIVELELDFLNVVPDDDESVPITSLLKSSLTNEGRWIRRLQRLRDLDMSQDEREEPDTVVVTGTRALIGENGSGKSSILQAIALALAPDESLDGIDDIGRFVNRDAKSGRAEITVHLTNSAVFSLTISTADGVSRLATIGSEQIDLSASSDWFLLRAYSATRTLHGREHDVDEPARIANMFDPTSPLINAGDWLKTLEPNQFDTVAATLSKLFDSESRSSIGAQAASDERRLVRQGEGDDCEILVDGRPLGLVSDGYRAIVNLYCDIMAAADRATTSDMRLATGIVLIDEIGAHLHPRWRMKIAGLLRREFREMQIIVSTHEPLCLRGFVENEVVLVERDATTGVRAELVARNPSTYRVDQLLTSEFFGLHSTLDPEESDKLDIYYQLSARAATTPLTPDELQLLDETRPSRQDQVLGFSYREQLTYSAIDTYLTQRASGLTAAQQREQREIAFDRVSTIWDEFGSRLEQIENDHKPSGS